MPKKTPPFENWSEWTIARFWSFVRSALRSAYNRYPPKYELLKQNRVKVTGKRHKWEYTCAKCKGKFLQKDISVDHIRPVGTLRDYSDLPMFVRNLFCSIDDLQLLCKNCHQEKTNHERSKNKA